MDLKNYLAASRVIHETLSQIAATTYVMAWSECATPDNPEFVAIMAKRGELIAQFDRLHAEFLRTNPNFAA